ncbi:TPA: hypothetical protein NGT26_003174 [Vibrio parahaemolyticus]|nr:hypothetical protein [Vibrio parahaemolyticus]HCE2195154.1 hypothetical protein [Vibrio parahaemolyticus]HCG6674127.1 hypothetical protein [Vibrio parahaemolyticus]HCG7224921.1 hypothetical protein [Vibrio parahaemolyticus]HCG7318999.1 hypothetical protein [Vibrio parahaemolyticus]
MNAETFIENNIYNYLIDGGCKEHVAQRATAEGVKFFKQGNHKDPYFDSLCHAGILFAEALDPTYKFKKPKAVTAKPFVNSKPKPRKHNSQQSLI